MAFIDEHCQDCMKALGEEFREVHVWLDEFAKDKGFKHRIERHHREGVKEVREKWGDRAAQAAEIHIKRDWGKWREDIPWKSQVKRYVLCPPWTPFI